MDILINDIADEQINSYADAIRFTGGKLLANGLIQEAYIQACIDRETNYPTGLMMANGVGIAIPHANHEMVKSDSISVLRTTKPVSFGNMEDASLKVDCTLVFNLAFATGDQHITILRKLFTLFQDNSFIDSVVALDPIAAKQFIIGKLGIA